MNDAVTAKNTKRGDIIIRIPAKYLRYIVKYMEDMPEGTRVTNTKVFSDECVVALNEEGEDGSTLVHTMFDQAIINAVEWGAEGIRIGDDE